jgi:hypothetical protein
MSRWSYVIAGGTRLWLAGDTLATRTEGLTKSSLVHAFRVALAVVVCLIVRPSCCGACCRESTDKSALARAENQELPARHDVAGGARSADPLRHGYRPRGRFRRARAAGANRYGFLQLDRGSAVAAQTVNDLTHALNKLHDRGINIAAEHLAHFSPYPTSKVKRFGDYPAQVIIDSRPIQMHLPVSSASMAAL